MNLFTESPFRVSSMRLRPLVLTVLATTMLGGAALAGEGGAETQPITIETSDKPLETVLQWISRRAGVNVVCNEQDQPRVTLRLANVTWQEAVDQIARKYDFVIEKRGERIWELARPPKVRMEFQGASFGVILEALARQAGINIVIGDEIDTKRKLSMTLNGVPWREAMDVIVKSTGYAWVEQNYSIIRIVSKDNVQKDLETRIIRLNNIPAQKGAGGSILDLIGQQLETGEKVTADARTNSVILSASRPSIDKVVRLIASLDTRIKQVLIEVRLVDFSTSEAQSKGMNVLDLTFNVANLGVLGGRFSSADGTVLQGYRNEPGNTALDDSFGTRPVPTGTTRPSIGALYQLVASLNSSELLQAPQLLTLENSEAKLKIGGKTRFAEVTSVTAENGSVTRTLSEAKSSPVTTGIELKITPSITNDNVISLAIDLKDDNLVILQAFTSGSETIRLPTTAETELKTTLMVQNGDTAVMGGILRNDVREGEKFTPGLGRIPILGWLFKNKSNDISQRNLTLFITPRIVPLDPQSSFDQQRSLIREQLSGIKEQPAANPTAGPSLAE
ncbi:hypothetical protein LBMAG53_27160 [Planctomycetota bacterium]|nr:hypothetical protein LBMAG53_27160 [Planctomycetota bacterium]